MDLAEQRRVLSKRRGRTIGQRTILKSYVVEPGPDASAVELSHTRKAEGLPIYSVGEWGGGGSRGGECRMALCMRVPCFDASVVWLSDPLMAAMT